ncbi:C25 family cysteine peptidase, partial [Candidatus Eisenbacteria bacterium]
RGVDVVRLGITPFQYNPTTKELVVYTELEVRVTFQGGNGHFGEDRLRSRHWEPLLKSHLMNYDTLEPVDFNLPRQDRYGYEYVILSPDDPDFIAWADSLKAWRTLQGISTQVFTTSEIGGTTTTIIENWINDAYANWEVPPVAFLLLGDYPASGERDTGITSPVWSSYCVSDNIYADYDNDDLPDMAHARITARNAAELQTMIEKMLTYERNPYTDPDFYDKPVIAGGWQDERWFILCTETIFGYLANELGKSPIREYAIYSGSPSVGWSTNPNTYMILDYFGPDGLGYIPATPAHLTDFGANAARLNLDINRGTYMVMHRDHGGETGWGEPNYSNSDLNGLTNEMYPFVFSINCLTGKYNWSSECFTEKFHRMNYGALGLIAASETSYSFVNDTFIWGMCDGLWPDFMPAYGPNNIGANNERTAFAMASGKHFLAGSSWPYNPGDKDVTYHLFHHHGDAFVTMYTEMPQDLTVVHDGVCFTDIDVFTIQADEGSVIALTVGGEIIGVADGTGVPQDITIIPQAEPALMRITVTKANHFRHVEDVEIIPPAGPYLTVGDKVVDDDMIELSAGNGDADCDAGEVVELSVTLNNVGSETAMNVRATLTSEDTHCHILNNYAEYGNIWPDTGAPGLSDYVVQISPSCPDGHQIMFMLSAESDSADNRMVWDKYFTMSVEAPVMELVGYTVDDLMGGNGNGRVEPGEAFRLYAEIKNTGTEDATNVDVHLVISDPLVTKLQDLGTIALLPADGQASATPAFEVEVDAGYGNPDMMFVMLALRADWTQCAYPEFQVPIGGFFDNMEAGVGRWSNYAVTDSSWTNQWHQSTTRNHTPGGGTSWKFGDTGAGSYASLSDGALQTEAVTLRQTSFLRFHHWMEGEVSGMHAGYCYDGGMVEMSINGGPWAQITPVGDYPYLIRQGGTPGPWPAETPVYSGTITWAEAVFEISGYEGDMAQFRFRFGSDGADVREGWYIDDVEFSGYGMAFSDNDEAMPLTLRPLVGQNHPNPFGPVTSISYRLPASTDASLRVFDPAGRLVRTLVAGRVPAGEYQVSWDGRDDNGASVGSGVYFYHFQSDGIAEKKMILAR